MCKGVTVNILLVDDDVNVLESLQRGINYKALEIDNVYAADTAMEAKEILNSVPINIVVTDIEMPQESGIDLLTWTKDNNMNIVTIFCTGYADFNYAKKAVELQCFDYYLKPITFSDFESIIKKAVEKVKKESKYNENLNDKIGNINYLNKSGSSVDSIKQYINQHYNEDITRNGLAETVYLNSDYMARLFKKEEGCSITDYVINVRIKKASELLIQSNLSINEIALDCGYDNFAYFSRLFKKITGYAPKEYRKIKEENRNE